MISDLAICFISRTGVFSFLGNTIARFYNVNFSTIVTMKFLVAMLNQSLLLIEIHNVFSRCLCSEITNAFRPKFLDFEQSQSR